MKCILWWALCWTLLGGATYIMIIHPMLLDQEFEKDKKEADRAEILMPLHSRYHVKCYPYIGTWIALVVFLVGAFLLA